MIAAFKDSQESLEKARGQTIDWDAIFERMDLDGTGKINFREFMAACYNKDKLFNDRNFEKVFKMLDYSKTGNISVDDLRKSYHLDEEEKKGGDDSFGDDDDSDEEADSVPSGDAIQSLMLESKISGEISVGAFKMKM